MSEIMGRQIKCITNLLCDFDGEGHAKVIPRGGVAYQVVQGKAQGLYHGPRCYHAARQKYEAKEKELHINQDE